MFYFGLAQHSRLYVVELLNAEDSARILIKIVLFVSFLRNYDGVNIISVVSF